MTTSSALSVRPSGIEWIGEVPDHWAVAPLFARYRVQLGKMLDESRIKGTHLAPYLRNVDVQWDRVNTVDLPEMDFLPDDRTRFLLADGDLLVCEGGEAGRTAMWSGELQECYYQKAIHRLRPVSNAEYPRFFFYVMFAAVKRGVFIAGGNPNTIDHLTAEKLRRHRFPFPPKSEQEAISDFLDRKTAQIDALIGKKQRQIELLQEKRQALISQAVAGREGMTELKLGLLIELLPGFAFRSEGFSQAEDDIRLLRGVNVGIGSVRWEETVRWPSSELANYSEYCLRPGDLVLGMDRPWISTGIRLAQIIEIDTPSLLLQRVARLRARRGITQSYLKLLLSSIQFRSYFEPILTGVSVPHISPEQIQSFRFRLPELSEQVEVCSSVEEETSRIDRMTIKLIETIDKLGEYRQALITAAVTGKIRLPMGAVA